MIDQVKLLLGIADGSKDGILQYTCDFVTGLALRYCRLTTVPDDMALALASMAAERYRANGYGQDQTPQQMASVAVGDETVTFQKPRNVPQSYILSSELTDGEKSMLRPWRKLWP